MGSLHSLETTLHSLQQTYLRPSIYTTQNFKWSRYTSTTLNISQLQTFIYLLETAHPRTTKQLTRTYNTAYSTSRIYQTQSSPEMCTLWHSYTDDHRGQLIANVITNSDHITLNTNTPTRVPSTTLQHTSSPDITTVYNTLYNRTSWTTQHALSSDHLPIITTINIRHDYRLQQNRRTFTNYKKADWTQFMEDTESAFAQTTTPINIHTANIIFTNIILMVDKHNIPKGKMHNNCRLLPDHIVCKITQRNNIRRANTCDPALKRLNEEITSEIQKHKQTYGRST